MTEVGSRTRTGSTGEIEEEKSEQTKPKGKKWSTIKQWEVPLIRKRGAILVLTWNAFVFGYQFIFIHLILSSNSLIPSTWYSTLAVFMVYFVLSKLFYPLAGWLADVHYGRHTVMRYSMILMWIGSLVLLLEQLIVHVTPKEKHVIVEGLFFTVVFLLNMFSLAGFHTNILPFAMDQMPDASTEQFKAVIRWYYWTRNIGVTVYNLLYVITCFAAGIPLQSSAVIPVVLSAFFITLAVSSDFIYCGVLKKDHRKQNPMQEVRQVLVYAAKHEQPVWRSAFTYNPSFNPKRIDYAMNYFGGPFTYEQVENVKTFLNMLKIIAVFGCFVFLQSAVHVSTQYFVDHLEKRAGSLFSDTCFTPQLLYWIFNPPFIIFAIPMFEFLIQPIFARRELFPSTLKRVGVAMCISFVATFMFLILDIVGHAITPKSETAGPICMFLYTNDRDQSSSHNNDGLTLSGWSLVIPILLGTIGEMIGYIGAYEFICAQSPYSMRGFMIGFFYFLNGVFSLFTLLLVVMFALAFQKFPYEDCGLGFYTLLLLIGIVSITLYSVVTYKYKRRERQYIGNEQQMIEACYERNLPANDENDKFEVTHVGIEPQEKQD